MVVYEVVMEITKHYEPPTTTYKQLFSERSMADFILHEEMKLYDVTWERERLWGGFCFCAQDKWHNQYEARICEREVI